MGRSRVVICLLDHFICNYFYKKIVDSLIAPCYSKNMEAMIRACRAQGQVMPRGRPKCSQGRTNMSKKTYAYTVTFMIETERKIKSEDLEDIAANIWDGVADGKARETITDSYNFVVDPHQ